MTELSPQPFRIRTAEVLTNGCRIVDIAGELPRHPIHRYQVRTERPRVLIIHHSAVDTDRDGAEVFVGMANYHIDEPPKGHGWPGIAYHYGICARPDGEGDTVYRLASEHTVRFHSSGRANHVGAALVLQGHLGDHDLTEHQKRALAAFLPHWLAENPGARIGWHAIASRWGGEDKSTCPGKYAVAWLEEWLQAEKNRPGVPTGL